MRNLFTRRRSREPACRLFFASDIHGSERCFRKWLNAARVYGVDVLLLGGDVTGKTMVPLVANGRGQWSGVLHGKQVSCRNVDELTELQASIRAIGYYDVVVTPDDARTLESDASFQARLFQRVMEETLERWLVLADERLDGSNVQCFAMLGNDDLPELAKCMRKAKRIFYAEDSIYELPGGIELASFGYSTPTPWSTPRELAESDMARRIEELVSGLQRPERAIFNFHCPPKDTHLDQAPRLDGQLRPVVDAGGAHTVSAGSGAVRAAIEKYQPVLGLHGHVHESPAAQRIGTSLCINPGSDYPEGVLRGALVTLGIERGVLQWQLTQG